MFVCLCLIRRLHSVWFWRLKSEKKSALSSWSCSTRWRKTTGEATSDRLLLLVRSCYNAALLFGSERLEKEREILEERAEKRVEILKNLVSKTVDLTTSSNDGCMVRKLTNCIAFCRISLG